MRFESLTVARRLALMLLVALAGMVLLAFAALYENRDDMRDGYARNVRSQIELATGVLAHFLSLEQAGALDRGLDRGRAELRRGEAGQVTLEAAQRGAGDGNDDDGIGHATLLFGLL